eukprot:14831041-Alexandrium_andersonii.AAC.1
MTSSCLITIGAALSLVVQFVPLAPYAAPCTCPRLYGCRRSARPLASVVVALVVCVVAVGSRWLRSLAVRG